MLTAVLLIAALQANTPDEFPKKAHVVVECVAGPDGTASGCRAVEVSHPGQGLEGAALSAVRHGHVQERNGVPDGQTFRVRIAFRMAGEGDNLGPPQSSGDRARNSSTD
ncbi:energy transducer TonB [Brevundimonas sp. LM2]|nr:energy transducer TonB [Brevundimonas sp. LM2]